MGYKERVAEIENRWKKYKEVMFKDESVSVIFGTDDPSALSDVDIAAWISVMYPDSLVKANGDTLGDAIATLEHISEFFISEELGMCSCGNRRSVIEKIVTLLEYFSEDYGGWQTLSDACERIFGVKCVSNDPLLLFMAYTLDSHNWTEHGTSINYCWLTGKGKIALYILRRYLDEDPE